MCTKNFIRFLLKGLLLGIDVITRACSEPTHLLLGTYKDNHADAIKAGTHASVTKPTAILTEGEVKEIRKLYKTTHLTQKDLAIKFCVSIPTISMIITRKIWK